MIVSRVLFLTRLNTQIQTAQLFNVFYCKSFRFHLSAFHTENQSNLSFLYTYISQPLKVIKIPVLNTNRFVYPVAK